ncbi:MAG TPA: hypothetical protein VM008_12350 [Phycisphaerae bacterium]|nr:hypothetical protein [Phycisphaerae bacterium]
MTQQNGIHAARLQEIERQARLLAQENRLAEPEITRIFWFPSEDEVRLVELDATVPPSGDGRIHPYFFRPSPQDGLPAPSGIALIRPDEHRRVELPESWGDWENAVEIEAQP